MDDKGVPLTPSLGSNQNPLEDAGMFFFGLEKLPGSNEVALRFSKVWLRVFVAGKKLGRSRTWLEKKNCENDVQMLKFKRFSLVT